MPSEKEIEKWLKKIKEAKGLFQLDKELERVKRIELVLKNVHDYIDVGERLPFTEIFDAMKEGAKIQFKGKGLRCNRPVIAEFVFEIEGKVLAIKCIMRLVDKKDAGPVWEEYGRK